LDYKQAGGDPPESIAQHVPSGASELLQVIGCEGHHHHQHQLSKYET